MEVFTELGPVLGVPGEGSSFALAVCVHTTGPEAALALLLQVVTHLRLVAAGKHRGPPGGVRGGTWVSRISS